MADPSKIYVRVEREGKVEVSSLCPSLSVCLSHTSPDARGRRVYASSFSTALSTGRYQSVENTHTCRRVLRSLSLSLSLSAPAQLWTMTACPQRTRLHSELMAMVSS